MEPVADAGDALASRMRSAVADYLAGACESSESSSSCGERPAEVEVIARAASRGRRGGRRARRKKEPKEPQEAPERGEADEEDDHEDADAQRRRPSDGKEQLWCHLHLNPEMAVSGFDLNKKIIGRGGRCTKGIFEATGAKVRLRGVGSGFREARTRSGGLREARVPLMLAITSDRGDRENFRRAVEMAVDHLRSIGCRFASFNRRGCGHERPPPVEASRAFWVGGISAAGWRCCAACLHDVHVDAHAAGMWTSTQWSGEVLTGELASPVASPVST